MVTTDRDALATGELRSRLQLRRLLRQPQWVLDDLAPTRGELRDPAEYLQGIRLWHRVRQDGYTMLGCRRARTLHRLARRVERTGISGAIVDCGVWNGGSTAIMAAGAPTRTAWAFDSFEGLPEPIDEDGEVARDWVGSTLGRETHVEEAFRRYARPDQLRIVKGWFKDTLAPSAAEVGPIALLHADGDMYDSIKLTLDVLYDQVTGGGWVVVDDYRSTLWPGARRAVDDFRAERAITSPLLYAEGSAYWRA